MVTPIERETAATLIGKRLEKVLFTALSDQEKTDSRYLDIAYQLNGLLLQNEPENSLVKMIENKNYEWNSPWCKVYEQRQKELDDFLANPIDVVEGVSQCRHCKSRRTIQWAKQTRSGDEATSTFVRCVECGKQWMQSS